MLLLATLATLGGSLGVSLPEVFAPKHRHTVLSRWVLLLRHCDNELAHGCFADSAQTRQGLCAHHQNDCPPCFGPMLMVRSPDEGLSTTPIPTLPLSALHQIQQCQIWALP